MEDDRAVPRLHARDPITGWRVWNLSDGAEGPRLWPAGSGVDVWQPRLRIEARCGALRILTWRIGKHAAPASELSVWHLREQVARCLRTAPPCVAADPGGRDGLPLGNGRSSTSEGGEGSSPILRDSGWCVRCVRGSNLAQGCRRSCTPSANASSRSVSPIEGGSRSPTVDAARQPARTRRHSDPDSWRRTRWTSFPKMPFVGCSSSRAPSIVPGMPTISVVPIGEERRRGWLRIARALLPPVSNRTNSSPTNELGPSAGCAAQSFRPSLHRSWA